ncbi:MAG TPA: ABC transporter ATP-binding protein [Candidatus Hydrogenedentes bacterium]|nr:ABC transporter ATP-binding protein [FCB group bacterium]HNZ16670.1 ABC transporter ATP-binding protein [Candidatus Hydrogenedentota bacterium]HOH32251.1 ABC transporter ATP-binding protein [Candidatus Hydrogenedentota bacterium]HPA04129.1 ABC transporter ATP-binding protein [Candidatus Hydrogenedentota bacterium]HPV39151.1 ABC transporter ATP-binding protein [Candidatus Hydrogenedentota bacterium]
MTPIPTQPDAGTDVIRLEHVSKTYTVGEQEVHAVDNVSLAFAPGAFCAVMGPSGSGKSTMLNLLGCLDRPSSGCYMIAGEDVSKLDDDRLSDIRLKHLGFVFQSFNLIPQLTVLENIALPLFYLGWSTEKSAAHAAELAETVGLSQRLRHRPTELSGGQQQRVAIARALANDPKIILADEPTGNLDTSTGDQIMALLCDLNRQGKTIIMVTHEPSIALHAKRRIHMLDGHIERIEDDA